MNFTAYIERQKNLIRSRHEDANFLIEKDQPLPDTDKLLNELDSLRGLNVFERVKCGCRRGIEA